MRLLALARGASAQPDGKYEQRFYRTRKLSGELVTRRAAPAPRPRGRDYELRPGGPAHVQVYARHILRLTSETSDIRVGKKLC